MDVIMYHPHTAGHVVVTREAFDDCWSDLGWQVTAADDRVAAPTVPLQPLPGEGDIPAAELAGEQPPPRNASGARWSRFLAAAGVPHDPTAGRDALLQVWDAVPPKD